jgi:pleiotropic regulator 1
MISPLIGHTNRINCIVGTDTEYIITTSNDCTVRQWEYESGQCTAVFKFADPVSVCKISNDYNMLFTASWDKMIRCVDLETNKIVKSFIASKEAIKCLCIQDNQIFVAGIDPIIRAFNIESGETQMFQGHKGWVYTVECYETGNGTKRMVSGGDDHTIIIWDIEKGKMLEQLRGHENGVTSIGFAYKNLYTGSFDHHVICWDLADIDMRIEEK